MFDDMHQKLRALAILVTGGMSILACAPEGPEELGQSGARLAHPGPWVIPESTLLIGDTQYVEYTGAGPWVGESGCADGLTPGAAIVRDYLYEHFPQTPHIGGFACRPIYTSTGESSTMSVHGTGRALDVMIPTDDGEADNDLGDPVGNFLIENAEAIGIQYIIWDLWTWGGHRDPGEKDRAYGGDHPHHDHLHIELSVEASENSSPWFEDQVTPPAIDGCDAIGPEGGIIDDTSPCFRAFGSQDYWRIEEGVGYDGRLLWTNAFESDGPSNWARWHLIFEQAGNYEVEVFLDPAFAVADGVRYEVSHSGESSVQFVDQSSSAGWVSLGQFAFDEEGDQQLDVFDDQPQPVADDQHIVVDAIRLTGEGSPPPDDPGNPLIDDPSTPDPSGLPASGIPGDGEGCSCRVPDGGPSPRPHLPAAILTMLLLAWARRRR